MEATITHSCKIKNQRMKIKSSASTGSIEIVTCVQKWTYVIISTGLVQLGIGPKPLPTVLKALALTCDNRLTYTSGF